MKLLSISLLAMLAAVEAAPLRVVMVANISGQDLSQKLRFGHAVPPPAVDATVAGPNGAHNGRPTGRPCMMRKMVEVSNAFRKAVGLPLIDTSIRPIEKDKANGSEPVYSILPFIGTPPTFVKVKDSGAGGITAFTKGGDRVRIVGPDGTILIKEDPDHPPPPPHPPHPPHHPHKHHKHRKHHKHHGCRRSPFLYRLNFALLSLGKWEGRSVAFVLGCGLGVILRMFWVLSVVTFRAIRGSRREEVEYTIIHEYIPESPVPPPSYPVEKAEKAEDKMDNQIATA